MEPDFNIIFRLEIVSHRTFMGRILAQTQGQKGWPMYAQLLIDLVSLIASN